MMDRSELIRYANDTLLDEFQQRLTIQIRYIDNQIAMLKKELGSLESERSHLNKFFPEQQPQPKLSPNPQSVSQKEFEPIPSWLQQEKKAAE